MATALPRMTMSTLPQVSDLKGAQSRAEHLEAMNNDLRAHLTRIGVRCHDLYPLGGGLGLESPIVKAFSSSKQEGRCMPQIEIPGYLVMVFKIRFCESCPMFSIAPCFSRSVMQLKCKPLKMRCSATGRLRRTLSGS
jgi:hypothetical protein